VKMCVSSIGLFASGVPRVDDRSVFEKNFLECEASDLEPEATTFGDGAVPLVGDGAGEEFVRDDVEGFTEAAARLIAARPLAARGRT